MEKFVVKPSIDLYDGVRVTKDTVLEYSTDTVDQLVKDLKMHTTTKVSGEGYDSTVETTVYLKEGDVLIFEDGGRGYIKPIEGFVSVSEAISVLECINEGGNK